MFYWMLMDMCLSEFGNYQVAVAQIVLRATQILDVLFFFKKLLSGVPSEIYLVRRNIGSTGKYFLA